MSDVKVLTLVGSMRAASVNPQIAALAAATAPAGITVNVYQGLGAGLGELPLYNEDNDNAADLPASASTLRGGTMAGYGRTMRPASHSGSPGPTLSMRPRSRCPSTHWADASPPRMSSPCSPRLQHRRPQPSRLR